MQSVKGYRAEMSGARSPWLKIPRVAAIVREVMSAHNEGLVPSAQMTVEEVFSASRERRLVITRADIMRRLRTEARWSYPRIAALFGRDHSTVMYQVKRAAVDDHGLPSVREQWLAAEYQRHLYLGDTLATSPDEYRSELARRLDARRERARASERARAMRAQAAE